MGSKQIKKKVDNFIEISDIVCNNLDNLNYETKAELCKILIKEIVLNWTNVSVDFFVPISPKNKLSIKTDVVKDFFNTNKEFITTKAKDIKNDIDVWLSVINNLRRYYHHWQI